MIREKNLLWDRANSEFEIEICVVTEYNIISLP